MIILNKFTKHLYRRKVIGIITNNKGEYLIDQLTTYGKNDWNFSGGGIEKGETEEEALFRELQEEMGTNKFRILNKSKNLITYNWPIKVIIRRCIESNGIWLGQSQKHFLIKFTGIKEDIRPDPSEIRKIKWIKRSEFKKYLNFKNQFKITEEELKQFK